MDRKTDKIPGTELKKYRGLLKIRTGVCIAFGLFAAALSIADHYKLFGSERTKDFAGWFRAALILLGLGALMVILIYVKAFDAEGTLKRLYNEEHDPAEQRARSLSGLPFTAYFSAVTASAGIIAAYFNRAVFFALFIAATVLILSSMCLKYIIRKYF